MTTPPVKTSRPPTYRGEPVDDDAGDDAYGSANDDIDSVGEGSAHGQLSDGIYEGDDGCKSTGDNVDISGDDHECVADGQQVSSDDTAGDNCEKLNVSGSDVSGGSDRPSEE
ncbi:hypothetical protein HPB50_013529 [Hyalomma asiaticum]|uniref:Uncharacterized protein n=1 Tax=Hyalomma asiaticum TaxID=266040 RepID=A0ACB7RL74_HYAAI|nr:hypothetical protein HPB50_013529 [Hyalomma asiaticum]